MIFGEKISLRPSTLNDKEKFYQWATNSDSTSFWYGDLYGDTIPEREEFFKDWTNEYFLDSENETRRSYIIFLNEDKREIGQINYQMERNDEGEKINELDIIIADHSDKGQGYGTEAIKLLTAFLKKKFSDLPVVIYALAMNTRATQSYTKANFKPLKYFSDDKGNKWIKFMAEDLP